MTRRFIVEPQQDAVFSNRSFSIKTDKCLLSYKPSGIANKNGFKRPDLPSDDKRQRFFSYEVKTTLIESISWHVLYATNLLVAFELIITSKTSSLGSSAYSRLPIEEIVTVGWLLESYWNPDSPLFKPTEQAEVRLTQGSQPFAIAAMMHGSGDDQQQSQLSESSGQQAPEATSQPASVFTSPLSSGSGDGYRDPQQHVHTLGLDCFVHPCHGICKLRPPFENMGPAERSLISEGSLASHTGAIGIVDNPVNTTAPAVPVPCNLTMLDEDGQLRNCEKVYKSVQSLLNHQRKIHTGKKTCLTTVVGNDGRLRPCGEVWKNAVALLHHRRTAHTSQQTCDLIMVTEDGQERPCGKVCMNASALSSHRTNIHTGQRTCDVTLIGEYGQPRPCGKVCNNTQALYYHKRREHTGRQTCVVMMAGEDGERRPCGKVCNNAQALNNHKRREHTGRQTCGLMMVTEDGQRRPCGKVYKNRKTLWDHKKNAHTGQKACDVILADEDGQQRPCGKVYKNAKDLSVHKRTHLKRKPVDTNQKDGLSPP
ncbi:hypothetical protein [Endozoicomonas sp. 8E]|uniref:hypothetical protein n=1 Tax=Endozoicomonas sp. 8E TaxID=3035692 RepID=UPI0029392CE8|nr:hypothetical protein [Endozoicomonas sp. 8E]WOG26978.1 hypothetical protein P6910_20870 [Endozoicomonas sp. 8E]